MHEKEKIFGLDLARCIAICCVLLAHTLFLFPISAKSQFFGLAYFGFIGVEIFFVLSGYLVGTILINLFKNNPVDRKTTFYFWIRRWFRTLPNYYLVLLLASGLYYFSTKFFPFSDPQYFLYFIFSQNLLTPHPDFFSIAWSLSVEEWFYLVMPLWMIFCYQLLKGSNKFLLTAIISFILIILSIRIAINFLDPPEWEFGLLRVVIYRMDAIMIGVLAAYLHLHKPVLWVKFKRPFGVLGILLFIFISVVFYYNIMGEQKGSMFFFYTFFFNVVSISIALMFPYLSGLKVKSPGFFQSAVIHTSRISYSLYLIHLLVASVVITIINKIVPEWYLLKFVAIILSCFVCATILYSIYELPMMNLRDKYKLPGKKT